MYGAHSNHGNGNVSSLCYEMIGAKAYIWEINERWFFGESGATLGELNGGMFRSRDYVMRLKPKKENIHWVAHDILSVPLPIPRK